jgi:hypothetical protein
MKPPSKRQAMREAKHLAAGEINRYLDVGQPIEDHGCVDGGDPCEGCQRVVAALRELAHNLANEAGLDTYNGGMWWDKRDADGMVVKSVERRGWIVLSQGSEETSPVTILAETPKFYLIRHESDWADRKCGDERRMLKRNVAVKP